MFKKQLDNPPLAQHLHLKVHGGLGDLLWLHRKFARFDKPLFLDVSEENRTRPRRCGYMADHLPNVIGWRFDGQTFSPGGNDWTSSADDPACAIDKRWSELVVPTHEPMRLECNRWLESGRRLEGWLPDLPTTHHFEFEPCGPPNIKFRPPYVVVHLAGWPDVGDYIWHRIVKLFAGVAYVYIVGGSYDYRPKVIASGYSHDRVALLEDLAWEDLQALLRGCEYVFGHASGLTIMADVLRCRGVVVNPRSLPFLCGTWNSPENPGLVHVAYPEQFESAVRAAFNSMAASSSTWPPVGFSRGVARVAASAKEPSTAVRSIALATVPHSLVIFCFGDHPEWLASAAIDGCLSGGQYVGSVLTVGCDPRVVDAANRASARSSKRPAVHSLISAKDFHDRHAGFELGIVFVEENVSLAYSAVSRVWASLTQRGTLLAGGRSASAALRSFGASLGIEASAVDGVEHWAFIHRRR